MNIRERILELAVEAIDAGGEEAIRVNDIAAEAGVTVPTLYRHFGSRDGLVEAAQTYRFRKTQFVDSSVLAASLAKCKNRVGRIHTQRFDNGRAGNGPFDHGF